MTYLPLLSDDEMGAAGEAGVGAVATERGNLPLQAIDVDATLTGLVARVALTQTFGNRFDQPLEASYIFPLPDRAAVTEFRMEVGERVVEGVLKERGQARADYDTAVKEGRRASIAEEERPGVFTMRVGNLLPGERVTVRLVMTGPLPWDEGEATFRFPLVVAPRYIPGSPLEGAPVGPGTEPDTDAVPDASRITPPVLLPGFPNPVDLSIRVLVDPAGLDLGDLRSSLHAVVEEDRDGSRLVRVEPGERANRDFVLRARAGSAAVATAVTTAEDDEGGQGTFALTLLPPVGTGADAAPPRDLLFVLDRSGSMAGWKMVAARRAVARMVDSLTERDRFGLLTFDNVIEAPPALPAGLTAAGDHARFQAVEFLSRLEARGGTEMAAPLARAVELLASAGEGDPAGIRNPALVLVTDGQVGNEDQILRLLAPRLGGVRVYTVGVDSAVNEGFLKRLAGLGGGACELVESEDRLDAVMDRVHRRIGAPVLTDLELEPDGLEIDLESLAPGRLPALFAGSPLVVSGRFKGSPGGAVTVRGRDAAGQPWSATVPATGGDAPTLTARPPSATGCCPASPPSWPPTCAWSTRAGSSTGSCSRWRRRPDGPCSSGSGWPPRPCRWPACPAAGSSPPSRSRAGSRAGRSARPTPAWAPSPAGSARAAPAGAAPAVSPPTPSAVPTSPPTAAAPPSSPPCSRAIALCPGLGPTTLR